MFGDGAGDDAPEDPDDTMPPTIFGQAMQNRGSVKVRSLLSSHWSAHTIKRFLTAASFEHPIKADPAKLRSAVTALRYALAHPMTSTSQVHASAQ